MISENCTTMINNFVHYSECILIANRVVLKQPSGEVIVTIGLLQKTLFYRGLTARIFLLFLEDFPVEETKLRIIAHTILQVYEVGRLQYFKRIMIQKKIREVERSDN